MPYLSSKESSQSFNRFCFPSAGGSIGVSTQAHVHALRESEVALVGERCVYQLGGVALVLVGVRELSIYHAQQAKT